MREKLYNYLMTHKGAMAVFLLVLTPFAATIFGLLGFWESFSECWKETFYYIKEN